MNKYQNYKNSLLEAVEKAPVTVASKTKKKDEWGGVINIIKFSNGKTLQLVKLNSAESMGLPGWHDHKGKALVSYLGDTIDDAISEYIQKMKW